MTSLTGQLIVVTGAASGIGAATVERLKADKVDVIATDLEARTDIRPLDVGDPTAWQALRNSLEGRPLHGLVNCAGTTWRARVGDVTPAAFHDLQRTNALGPLLGLQALAPLMIRGSSVVNVGSLAALQGHYAVAYTASKWSLRGITHAAALELGARGIRVNLVHPGFIDTAMTAGASPRFREAAVAATTLRRAGSPEEVAGVIRFLLGDEASFITGAEIPVDGGTSSHGGAKPISDALLPAYHRPTDRQPAKGTA
jgi:3alpha(or 20beta)-hydroxysteroid dehydrogenase